ncbi:hypothetical protein [Ellagibacter isourolithinifaciens]|uniref:hypothetical protein n=1 Tax=Ellagibacter isourolithinifaciens TaxID=2137581 RepID=UPI003AF1CA56
MSGKSVKTALSASTSRRREFLDEDSRLCRVYDERFTRCERCRRLTPVAALFGKHLPPTCGYVLRFR